MASFTTPLVSISGVTISVHITSECSEHAVTVGQLATQISISQDTLRQCILDSVAPYQQEQQPAPQTQAKPEPAAEPVPGPGQPSPFPSSGRNGVNRLRLDRASFAGQEAGQKLRNQCVSVPGTPEAPVGTPANKYFVVLRSSDDTPPAVYLSWKYCRPHVHDPPVTAATAVFHGFASITEVQWYCQAAKVEQPPVYTRMN